MPKTVRVKCRIDNSRIIYLNSILDSYEGIGLVRTIDASQGLVVIYSTDTMYKVVLDVLNAIKEEGMFIADIEVEENEAVDEW